MTTKSLGQEGFRWFVGTVENREDPLKLGRLRVRIMNVHSVKQSRVGTDNLPWATVMSPVTGANNNKVGQAPLGIQVGSTVIGFFMDGEDGNQPVIMGAIAGIPGIQADNHDVPPEAREINTVAKEQLGPEPTAAYRAKYPYNKVIRTEGGHVIEVDDTPSFERIHVYHKSGTYVEINETGRLVMKSADESFRIVAKDDTVYVQGNAKIDVKGNVDINVGGNVTGTASKWNLTGDVSIKGNLAVSSNINASGEITDGERSISGDRAIYNSHTHSDPQGGSVAPPNQQM